MHNFLNFILHVFGREKKIFFIVLYTSSLLSMHDQSLLDKYCPPEIKQLIIYFTLVSEKSDELERYKELQKTYRPVSLISKEFHKYSEKILFVACNNIVNELSQRPLHENDWRFKFCSKFKQAYGNYLYALQYDIYPYLKEKQSTFTIRDKQEFLRIVALFNSINAAKLLLQKIDFDINDIDEFGTTYLFDAVLADSYEVTDLLLQKGANVDDQDNQLQSPLYSTVFGIIEGRNDLAIIELLLKNNAQMHLPSRNDSSPYKQAKKFGWPPLIDLFDKYDKKTDTLQQP